MRLYFRSKYSLSLAWQDIMHYHIVAIMQLEAVCNLETKHMMATSYQVSAKWEIIYKQKNHRKPKLAWRAGTVEVIFEEQSKGSL